MNDCLFRLITVCILFYIVYNFTITNNTKQQCTVKNKVNTEACSCNAKFHPDTDQLIDNNGGSADFSVKNLSCN